jgi:hypothetical protein
MGGPVPLPSVVANCSQMRATVPMEILRESGEWRCIEIPGFLIYTRIPDANSRAFADELRRHNLTLAALRGSTDHFKAMTNQIPVVLRLLPQSGVFGQKQPAPVQAYDDELSLMYVVHLPSVVPVGETVAPVPLSEYAAGPPTAAEMLARDAFARRMRYTRPKTPEWMLHGFERLMQETRILGSTLQLTPPLSRPVVPTGPIEEIFTADFPNADEVQHEAWMRQSALFLRWTLIAEPERRDAVWDLAARAARGPIGEADFDAGFGMSYGELGVVLTDSRLRRGRLDAERAMTDPQLSQPRGANEEEVARLTGIMEGLNERAAAHNATVASTR